MHAAIYILHHTLQGFFAEMEGNEMNEDVEDVINEEDIVRVIPLDDTINGLARPPEVAGDGDGNEDTTG